jgi:hypothetical protein
MTMTQDPTFPGMPAPKPLFSRRFKHCFILFAITCVSAMALI